MSFHDDVTVKAGPAQDERDWVRPDPVAYQGESGELTADYRPAGSSATQKNASGVVASFIAPGSSTAGDFGLFQWDMPAHAGGPSAHFHRTFSESFYILAGSVRLYDGTRWVDTAAGDFLHVPRGGVHAFRNDGDDPASMLILFAPGAPRERYFRELAEQVASGLTLTEAQRREFMARHDQYQA